MNDIIRHIVGLVKALDKIVGSGRFQGKDCLSFGFGLFCCPTAQDRAETTANRVQPTVTQEVVNELVENVSTETLVQS